MSGRKTVLIVDDDPGTLYVLANGLSTVLALFDVITAGNGREAIDALEERQIDVLVTDLSMPVMDGFALIAYVTNRRSTLPVVVLSGMAPHAMDQRLAGYGGLRVIRKPAGYHDVAQCVLEEIERVDLGQVEGIPLASVLQLLEAERRSCSVVVTAGKRRGRLQFESGRLVNAFSDDFGAEGEAAAYDILSWDDTAIAFEQLPDNVRKLIHTPMQLMLIELAVVQDRIRDHDDGMAPDDAILEGDAGDGVDTPAPASASGDAPPEATAPRDEVQLATDDGRVDAFPVANDHESHGAEDDDLRAATDDDLHAAADDLHAAADDLRAATDEDLHPATDEDLHPATDEDLHAAANHASDAAAPGPTDVPTATSAVGQAAAAVVAPSEPDAAAVEGPRLPAHVRIVTSPDEAPPQRDAPTDAVPGATVAAAEAPSHLSMGNGQAMRLEPTESEEPMESRSRPMPPAATTAAAPTGAPNGEDADATEPTPPRASETGPVEPNAAHDDDGGHVAAMVAAVERLAQRARAADEALAAVAAEVEAFRGAQRRFDAINARREERRRELEVFREDVARLAREILGRVDGVFDAMADPDGAPDTASRGVP